jgi:heme exporter protein B
MIDFILQDLYQGKKEFWAVSSIFIFAIFMLSLGESSDKINMLQLLVLCFLLSSLNLNNLFLNDFEDGTLEWLLSQRVSLEYYMTAKCISYWLRTSVPLIVITSFLIWIENWPLLNGIAFIIGLSLGTLNLVFLGSIVIAQGKLVDKVSLPLLILPFSIPNFLLTVSITSTACDMAQILWLILILLGLFFITFGAALMATPFLLRQLF